MPVQKTFLLPGYELPALCSGDPEHHSAVIVLHGLGVSKEVQIPELERLRHDGFYAIGLDAPHHGSRDDGMLELFSRLGGHERHHALLSFVLQQASEVASLVDYLKAHNQRKVAVTGISMGGHVSFAMLRMKNRPDLLAPFLGTPDFRTRNLANPLPASPAETSGPADFIEGVFPAPLFIVTAGSDSIVNPAPAREFANKLQPYYKSCPEKLEYHEYPESDHMMRPVDWFDAWGKFLDRLHQEGF